MRRQAKKPTVVVIDDEPDFLRLVESWLRPQYEVSTFESADGAVPAVAIAFSSAGLLGAGGFTPTST